MGAASSMSKKEGVDGKSSTFAGASGKISIVASLNMFNGGNSIASGFESESTVASELRPSSKIDDSVNYRNSSVRQSSRTVHSVRAMALMNHSRQENSYISVDSISANLRNLSKRRVSYDSQPNGKADGVGSVTMEIANNNAELSIIKELPSMKCEEMPPIEEASPSGKDTMSLSKFRSSLTLKLNIEDDPEWAQVSDDDSDENELDLFNQHLIEIPLDRDSVKTVIANELSQSMSQASLSQSSQKVKRTSQQFTTTGNLLLDGTPMVVGTEGIVRMDKNPEGVTGKLPMRERLIILCKLGAGASSAVYKAIDLMEFRLVALKTIQVYEKEKRFQMIRELSALYSLLRESSRRSSGHLPKAQRPDKYIVDFYDAFSNPEDGVVSMMIEYMDGGSLQDIVDQGGCDDETTLANIAIQALKGLSLLHNSYQLHRDLKPANFLISHRGEVKVADLGILKQLSEGNNNTPGTPGSRMSGIQSKLPRTATFVGTATYMSPERIDGKEYSFPSDVWAFGLSMITLALGKLPIDTKGGYWTILHGIRDAPPPQLPADRFSREFVDFINCCMKRNPDERTSVKQLLKHPFLFKARPEDLTYAQSDERGINELHSILQGVVTHIEQLKADLNTRYHGDEIEYKESVTITHEKLFGNLFEAKTNEVLRKLIFDGISSSKDSKTPKRLVRPRLNVLAKQIHLPLEKVIIEAKKFCDAFDEKFSPSTSTSS